MGKQELGGGAEQGCVFNSANTVFGGFICEFG